MRGLPRGEGEVERSALLAHAAASAASPAGAGHGGDGRCGLGGGRDAGHGSREQQWRREQQTGDRSTASTAASAAAAAAAAAGAAGTPRALTDVMSGNTRYTGTLRVRFLEAADLPAPRQGGEYVAHAP